MNYKMVVIDIDGTLVDGHGRLADEDKNAIGRLLDSGVTVSLCTGRIIQTTMGIIDKLGLKTFSIFYDGALIFNPRDSSTIYSGLLEPATVREAVEFSRQNDIYLELYSNERFFAEKAHWSDEIHRSFFHMEPTYTSFDGICDREKLLKAEVVVHNEEEAAKAKLIQEHFADKLRFSIARSPAYPNIDFVNIVHPQVSKGVAFKKLVEHFGFSTDEVIAIGDGLNDIPLLKEAGMAVAMGNAFPEVKQVAHYITLPIEEHGVAAVVERFFLL